MPRRTAADEAKDVKDLDRQGTRNLYLLVRESANGKDEWRFPKGYVESGELLHEVSISCRMASRRNIHNPVGSTNPIAGPVW